MRSLFLVLLLANLLVFAAQFEVVRELVWAPSSVHPAQLNAERLRIIRDTSATPRSQAAAMSAG